MSRVSGVGGVGGVVLRRRWLLPLSAGVLVGACAPPRAGQPVAPVAGATRRREPEGGPPAAASSEYQVYVAPGPPKSADRLTLPLRLLLPAIGVDAPIVALGLLPDNTMEVPSRPDQVGWYRYSPLPGKTGNAVLAGHVVWYGVDGVFRRLADLRPGAGAAILAADGETRPFAVAWNEEYPVDAAPVARVFEALTYPALTLITCGGRWDAAARRFTTRVVVRAVRPG